MVPSERVTVPSSDWSTPLPACGAPVTVTGGQAEAHAPLQVDVPCMSASHRYMVLPWASTRNWPGMPETDASLIAAAALLDDALAAADGLLAWAVADDAAGLEVAVLALLELEPLEQAVAASTRPAAQTLPAIQFLNIVLPYH